jgi:gluconolactonase
MVTGRVLVDGTTTRPQLDHPECVALAPDGSLWCGGEQGQIYRVEPDGSAFTQVATTDGFVLGLAFGASGQLYVCDLRHHALLVLPAGSDQPEVLVAGIETPNFPCVAPDGSVWVTDSGDPDTPTGTIHRYAPDGSGGIWAAGPFHFANGLALAADGTELYVVETFASRISAVTLLPDGGAGPIREVARLGSGILPDGLALGPDGALYVGCYEPSRVLRVDVGTGAVTTYLDDPTAHLLCHPTNLVWRGEQLITANLGRWHLTLIE